jgi:hypothetical protein
MTHTCLFHPSQRWLHGALHSNTPSVFLALPVLQIITSKMAFGHVIALEEQDQSFKMGRNSMGSGAHQAAPEAGIWLLIGCKESQSPRLIVGHWIYLSQKKDCGIIRQGTLMGQQLTGAYWLDDAGETRDQHGSHPTSQ